MSFVGRMLYLGEEMDIKLASLCFKKSLFVVIIVQTFFCKFGFREYVSDVVKFVKGKQLRPRTYETDLSINGR